MHSSCESCDLLVFSHLRWDFTYQRPQHLLSRHAQNRRVFYFEDPIYGVSDQARFHIRLSLEGVHIVVPYLPKGVAPNEKNNLLKKLVDELIDDEGIIEYSLWYYDPKALNFTRHLKASTILYDCISDFPMEFEEELFQRADIVLTSGHSLYQAKKEKHANVHLVPNSVDLSHFSQSRLKLVEPDDQVNIPHPRVGYYGIIDDSVDLDLLYEMAEIRPDHHFILLGPVMCDIDFYPRKENIHYLGKKDYHILPLYLSGWDCAIIPMKVNEATRFLNPIKTIEYLAAGKPVVSSAIEDVIHPFKNASIVHIAKSAYDFIHAIEAAVNEEAYDPEWKEKVDFFLEEQDWNLTFRKILKLESDICSQFKNYGVIETPAISINGVM